MQIESVEQVVAETNEIVPVSDNIRAVLVRDLSPIAERLADYAAAATMPIESVAGADAGAVVCARIADDIKAVKGHDVLSKITGGLHALHRKWTGLTGEFITPMETARRQIKSNILEFERKQQAITEAEQRRLQAIADEAARKEQARLEKLAESRKTPEIKEAYREQAQAVAAPVIRVEVPKTNIRRQKRWQVKEVDAPTFFAAVAKDRNLWGYVEINNTRLQRGKAANPTLEIAGVTFEQVTM